MPEIHVQVNTIDEVRQALTIMKEHGFLVLDNTPESFSGKAEFLLRCNAAETALEFAVKDGVALTVSTTEVFSGTSPTSFTDLDLSGTVGVNKALVSLSFKSAADMNALAVRTDGDTNDYFSVVAEAKAYGCQLGHHDDTADLVLIVATSSSGIVEWQTGSAQTCTVDVLWYIAGLSAGSLDHGDLGGLSDQADHPDYLTKDGTRPLTADWDAGAFEIRAQTLEADVATGTAPLTIASTTRVANLNVTDSDKLDGEHASAFADASHTHPSSDITDFGGVIFASTADDTIANTASETSFAPSGSGSATIGANSMVVGQVYRIRASGILSTV